MTNAPLNEIPADLDQHLRRHNQHHLLAWWHDLDQQERQTLNSQIRSIDFDLISRLLTAEAKAQPASEDSSPAERARRARGPSQLVRRPASPADDAEWQAAHRRGMELLAAGKVGVLLVAGGQATRLAFDQPKGMFPIGPVSGCSLFQILAEQLSARSRQAGVVIPYYIMTSDATHADTVAYFQEHRYFGLDPSHVFFFQQGNMPAVDIATGRLLLSEKGRLCTSPDGHGGMLAGLAAAGLVDDMRSRGIELLYYHQVDNPTAKVCDPAFLGFHVLHSSEMTTKVVPKRSAQEAMGVVCDVDGQTQIVEYSDMPADVAAQTDASGNLLLWAGNMAIHIFDVKFLERLLTDDLALPFHLARKIVPCLDASGIEVTPAAPNAYKFERFIFDALPRARRALVVEADRAGEFNPVKNAHGNDSPETSKAAMIANFSRWLREAGAVVPENTPVEIAPLFALDEADVRRKVQPGTKYTGPIHLK